MDAEYLKQKFDAGLDYADYVAAGTEPQQANWREVDAQVQLTAPQRELLSSFTREMRVIVLSGVWCGDCVQQGPLLAAIAAVNPEKIRMRWLERDDHADLAAKLRINGGERVPVVLFCAEDHVLAGWYGDRTLTRYRALAAKQLGGACPLPGAPIDGDELAATLQDWVDQFERIHLMLRLSTRLRQLHGD